MSINSRFTESTMESLSLARKSAQNREHGKVDTDDIVLGIVLQRNSYAAQSILDTIQDYRKIETAMEAAPEHSSGKRSGSPGEVLEFNSFASSALTSAVRLAEAEGQKYVGPEYVLLAILSDPTHVGSKLLQRIGADPASLRQKIRDCLRAGNSGSSSNLSNNPMDRKNSQVSATGGRTPALDKYTRDLTDLARRGKLRPVFGRDEVIDSIIEILGLVQKNNPVVVGEAGVGKTALWEGLAQRIVSGAVPLSLRDTRLLSLDIAALIAGTIHRGEFEERAKAVIDEVVKSGNIVLFADEVHMIMGAGASEGSVDLVGILKNPLSRGELRLGGTTTLDEYRQRIERDPALARRFQPVLLEEPDIEQTLAILCSLRSLYERHHGVTISDEVLKLAVKLADRYITNRVHPDKDLDVIDQAGSRLRSHASDQEGKLILDESVVAEIVSRISGVPVTSLTQSEKERLLNLESILHERVVGQVQAIAAVCNAMRRAGTKLNRRDQPLASFIFLGPTGVGKTQVAKTLAAAMFGSEDRMIRLDMSEYMERHTVSKLIGSPPGYVGYEDGGQLTNAVRKRPYTVVLFDEIEKAHPDVFNALLQVLDEGRLTDGQGRTVDFKNTVIIMTSNVGSSIIQGKQWSNLGFDFAQSDAAGEDEQQYQAIKAKVIIGLGQYFRPEFINRVSETIVFRQLSKAEVYEIIDIQLKEIVDTLAEDGLSIRLSPSARDALIERGYSIKYGARELQRAITEMIADPLAIELLKSEPVPGSKFEVDAAEEPGKLVFKLVAAGEN